MPKFPSNYRMGRRGAPRLNVRNAPQAVKQWLPSRRSLKFILSSGSVPITGATETFLTYSGKG